jgi:hypothetical protein
MDKNWLIRTKSNHILGPVSKEKVLELYQNGSIKSDDEICSGNGYWFYIREDDLVTRFLLGAEVQTFNPISEAKDILTSRSDKAHPPEELKDDITLIGGINLSLLNQQDLKEASVPPLPELPSAQSAKPVAASLGKESAASGPKKKSNPELKRQQVLTKHLPKTLNKQDWLKYAGIIGFLVLFLLIYFRKTIMHNIFQVEATYSLNFINMAHAQEIVPEKKKSF